MPLPIPTVLIKLARKQMQQSIRLFQDPRRGQDTLTRYVDILRTLLAP